MSGRARTGPATALASLTLATPAAADHSITEYVSRHTATAAGGDGNALFVGMTPSGSHAYFRTPAGLVAEDEDGGAEDVYRWSDGVPTLVSAPTGVLDAGGGDPLFRAVSADGQPRVHRNAAEAGA